MMRQLATVFVFTTSLICICAPQSLAAADELFFTSFGTSRESWIWRVDSDGTRLIRIGERHVEFGIPELEFNQHDQRLYWSEHYGGIWRSDINGEDPEPVIGHEWFEPLITFRIDAHGIAFDGSNMYWGDWAVWPTIGRVELNSANPPSSGAVETIIESSRGGGDLTVDPTTEKIYWVGTPNCGPRCVGAAIQRGDLDGGNIQLLAEPKSPNDVALDVLEGKLYWSDNAIYRSNLDGTEQYILIDRNVNTFVLNPEADLIYFAEGNTLFRATLDGNAVATILPDDS